MDKSRKRLYRSKVKCSKCGKELDGDYNSEHLKIVHENDQQIKFHPIVHPKQRKLSFQVTGKGSEVLAASPLHVQLTMNLLMFSISLLTLRIKIRRCKCRFLQCQMWTHWSWRPWKKWRPKKQKLHHKLKKHQMKNL